MYLKALEIQGFKSFPDKTVLTFSDDITAIVGPNGSGKSNIADAILWVMGEQSSKTLRGGKMQDVIFGGTAARSAVGFAQVSLIIDNEAGILASEAEEVIISRKYYRSGESEYYINRESVRLKDVLELLMDTGMGRDGYSIIGQGRIAEIISGKPDERREVLDEAAGIARFRYRKEEAERRLARTEENLLRVNDKISELEIQVGPLKRQAETARKYLALRDELKELEVSLWMQTLDKLHEQSATIAADYDTAKAGLDAAKAELEELYAKSENLAERMRRKDVEADEARARLSRAEQDAAACESRAAVLKNNIENSSAGLERMRSELAEQKERTETLSAQIAERRARVNEIGAAEKELEAKAQSARNVMEGHRLKLENREREAQKTASELTKKIIELNGADDRISMLTEMEKDYEGFGKAVKTVMTDARRGALRGVHGTVAELIKADDRCALAIETALGAAIQNIVVDTQTDGRAAIEMLKRRDAGRATFLPLDVIRGGKLERIPPESEGCVGLAAELVSFDSRYASIIENLLGRTLVAETLGDAIGISKKNNDRIRIVTLDGQLINAGGSMTGGSAARNTGILTRANELEKLRASRGGLAKARDELVTRQDELKRELSVIRYSMESAAEEEQETKNALASLAAERKATEDGATQLSLLLSSMSEDADTRAKAIADIENGAESYRRELAAAGEELERLNARVESVRREIAEATAKKLEVEGERTRTDRAVQDKNSALLDMERTCARFEQKKLSADMEEKQILDKLWDGYQLSHSAAQELRKPVESLAKQNRAIAEIKRGMGELGTPNLGAIEEYDRVSERYEYLSTQRDDVEKAKRELTDIINDITSEMKTIFLREFAIINEKFSETFTELFGGGTAELVLESEGDVLECDIDIRIQPPGKAVSTLSLLSGGEMAFVAIALYFAIIQVRPTPFCVMDEIEAALDESNVIRYAEFMRRLSGKTQFIVITHRRGTMEEADHLYGVTMQEKGVSRVIELDLAEAEKHIEENEAEWDSSIK